MPVNKNIKVVIYHRKPTEWEIKFGHGAIHYKEFEIGDCLKKDGAIKKFIKAKDDCLIYSCR
jgi:hypothetical protein